MCGNGWAFIGTILWGGPKGKTKIDCTRQTLDYEIVCEDRGTNSNLDVEVRDQL
jgi:hypothetical protein